MNCNTTHYRANSSSVPGDPTGLGILNELVTHRPLMLAYERITRANSHVALALRNAEAIEAMGLMPRVLRRWAKANDEVQQTLDIEHNRSTAIASASRSLRLFLQIAIVATGALLVVYDRTASGHIIVAVILTGRGVRPFEHLIDQWRVCLHALALFGRLRDLLDESDRKRGIRGFPPPSGSLEVEDLTFVPPGARRAVLRGVTFRAEPGEVIAVTGHSGAGKSTLARLIVGVFEPTEGVIKLDGRDIATWAREDLGPSLGYLPQNVGLFDVSVRDNISRLTPADAGEVVAAARRVDVHDMIGRLPFGYDTPVGEGGFVLTGGQRQRVGLARAFFGAPHLIVLDEPDASLDQDGEQALLESVRRASGAGAIVIVVSHRKAVVNLASKLLVLRDGEVEHFGPRPQVVAASRAVQSRPRSGSMLRLAGSDDPAGVKE